MFSFTNTGGPMSSDLEKRVARLEATEAVRYAFNRYFHAIDNNNIDLLINEVFTKNVVLEVANYPPGSGRTCCSTLKKKSVRFMALSRPMVIATTPPTCLFW